MEKKRERVFSRGTADCPFQRYRMQRSRPGGSFANIHWHPEAEILYMREGSVEVLVGKQTLLLRPGQIAFIHPGELHAIQNGAQPSYYDAFVYSLELLTLPDAHFFQQEILVPFQSGIKRFPTVLEPDAPGYGEVAEALDAVCAEEVDSARYKRAVFASLLRIFLTLEGQLVPVPADPLGKNNDTLKKCLRYMGAHLAEPLTLEDIAGQVHLHPNYLCALFKDYTGQTVFQHLIRMRVDRAAELLRTQSICVADAAAACGFESPGFFAKKFKALMGTSPKAYSLQYRNK